MVGDHPHTPGSPEPLDAPTTRTSRRSLLNATLDRRTFLVGAGPFPTTGTANPTLTVAALSLRAVGPIRSSLTKGG